MTYVRATRTALCNSHAEDDRPASSARTVSPPNFFTAAAGTSASSGDGHRSTWRLLLQRPRLPTGSQGRRSPGWSPV